MRPVRQALRQLAFAAVLGLSAPAWAAAPEGPQPDSSPAAPPAAPDATASADSPKPDATAGAESEKEGATAQTRKREIVVTASRLPEEAFDVPAVVHTVDADRVRDESYRTLPDALRDVPGVMVQKTGLAQGSPYLRGFTGYQNLLLIDGVRLNNSVFRSGPNQYGGTIDPLSILRMEIIQGPGSVMYGSDAVGGTVNVITRGPRGYGEGFQGGGRLSYRLSSAERSQTGRVEAYGTWDHTFGLYMGGSVKHYGDLEGGHSVGTQYDTGYREWDGDLKAEYFVNPDTRVVFGHQSVRQYEAPRTHQTVWGLTWEGLTPGTDLRRDLWQRRDLTYLQLHAEDIGSWVDAVHAGLSWQQQNETERRTRTRNRFETQDFEVGTLGSFLQLESRTPIGRLAYGVDFYHDTVNSSSSQSQIQGPVADDANYDLFGLYLQDTIPVCDRMDVTVGGRYDRASARAGSVQDPVTGLRTRIADSWNSFVASGRALYRLDPADHWHVFAGASQAFRAPNLSDLTRFDTARTNEIETPAPGLDPERYLTYEAGVKSSYDAFDLQFAYFYTVVQDMIMRVPTGALVRGLNEVTKRSEGDGFVQGVELAPAWRFARDWTAFGTLTWLDGEIDTYPTAALVKDREPVDRLMPATTQVGLRWDESKRRFWTEAAFTWADRQDDLSTRDAADTGRIPPNGTPGYATLALRAGWRVVEGVHLTFAVENVTNADYRIHGSGLNEPGRNFIFGLEMTR